MTPWGMRTVPRLTGFTRANRKAAHCGARVILIVERKPGRSAEFQAAGAGEPLFTYGLTGTIPEGNATRAPQKTLMWGCPPCRPSG